MLDAMSNDASKLPEYQERLRPVLGLFSAASIVVGGTIGSGVFFKPKSYVDDFIAASPSAFEAEKYVPLILGLWVLCGLVNLCGALTLAELSTMMPQSGGNYIYLRESYGRIWGFLWCWAEFWVIRSGSTAALAAVSTIQAKLSLAEFGYVDQAAYEKLMAAGKQAVLVPWLGRPFEVGFPLAVIVLLAAINIAGTVWGGAFQNVTTIIKVGFVAILSLLPLLALGEPRTYVVPLTQTFPPGSLLAAVAVTLFGIMWAYDGWGMVTVVAEEIRDPQRNVPRSLAYGVVFLTLIYFGANLAYHRTMSVETLASIDNAAEPVTREYLGDFMARLVQAMVMISVLGALNSNILVGPRVLFAAARDNPVIRRFAHVDPRFGTPALAIAGLSLWTCLLTLLGELVPHEGKRVFDVLTDYCVFGGSLFYLAGVVAVFVLRRKRPDAPRPYRTWGYPLVPLVFVAFYVMFLAFMLSYSWKESLLGLTLIAAGAVFYGATSRTNPGQRAV
jgi:APA family basic amino acid/polyamine antiporter